MAHRYNWIGSGIIEFSRVLGFLHVLGKKYTCEVFLSPSTPPSFHAPSFPLHFPFLSPPSLFPPLPLSFPHSLFPPSFFPPSFPVGFPLTVLGGIMGKNTAGGFDAPCRTKNIAREIPPTPWYHHPIIHMTVGGFLPFRLDLTDQFYFERMIDVHNYNYYYMLPYKVIFMVFGHV